VKCEAQIISALFVDPSTMATRSFAVPVVYECPCSARQI
jgi:hypothetical protein